MFSVINYWVSPCSVLQGVSIVQDIPILKTFSLLFSYLLLGNLFRYVTFHTLGTGSCQISNSVITNKGPWASSNIHLHKSLRCSESSPISKIFPPVQIFTFFPSLQGPECPNQSKRRSTTSDHLGRNCRFCVSPLRYLEVSGHGSFV